MKNKTISPSKRVFLFFLGRTDSIKKSTCMNAQLRNIIMHIDNRRVYFQNVLNPLLVFLRKTGFFDRIYTRVYGKTKFRF